MIFSPYMVQKKESVFFQVRGIRTKVPPWGGHTKMQVPPLVGQGFSNAFFTHQRTPVYRSKSLGLLCDLCHST